MKCCGTISGINLVDVIRVVERRKKMMTQWRGYMSVTSLWVLSLGDDDEGEISYSFNMAILDIDL